MSLAIPVGQWITVDMQTNDMTGLGHAQVVGVRHDPCVHQLAHTWALSCVLGTA